MNYQEFLESKQIVSRAAGFEIPKGTINPMLFPFQQDIVEWALARGRAAVFTATGTGKTLIQCEWAKHVQAHTGGDVLILAPLAVAQQTVREAAKLGIEITHCRKGEDIQPGINITNYEQMHKFTNHKWAAIVLDESSILKAFDGKMRKAISAFARSIDYRLACTATPAPNDLIEIINHAEFLDVMSGKEIIALFFKQDGNTTHAWRLKRHAVKDFYRWLASWAVALRKPSDLGYSDEGFIRPPVNWQNICVELTEAPTDRLFHVEASTMQERLQARRDSTKERIQSCVDLIQSKSSCGLTGRSDTIDSCGNQNISRIEELSINLTRNTESECDLNQVGPQSKIASICANTTNPIKTNGNGTSPQKNDATRSDERNTEQMKHTEKSASPMLETETSVNAATAECLLNSDSTSRGSTTNSRSNSGSVQSANANTIRKATNSILTTITKQEKSEVYCVQSATSHLANSKTVQKCSRAPLSICPNTRIDDPWVIWCQYNNEQSALEKAFGDLAISIYGSLSAEEKESRLIAWLNRERPILISKPSIAGYGLNFQLCHNTVYVGLSDSFEDLHQSISRFDRYGQTRQVNAYVITAETEGNVVANINRKRRQFEEMMDSLVKEMREFELDRCIRNEAAYIEDVAEGPDWKLFLGDSVEMIDQIETESVGLSVFSPPFPGMYVYSNSNRDMGNVSDIDQMIRQFSFLMAPDKLMRTLMPGRSCCVHLTQAVAFKGTDGYIGIKDFRGRVIDMMESHGWIYYGEVAIDKDPQVKAIRTKDAGLLFKSLASDSSRMHMALADYLLQFRKPGDNPEPIRAGISEKYGNGNGWITSEEWIEWAAPVWYRQTKDYPGGIRETDVLNVAVAREADDERHLCPLQLGVIERAVKLWSNPGDLVLSPFAGIGSEGYVSLLHNRKFVGIELKPSYWHTACRNLKEAESKRRQGTLLDLAS